MGGKCSGQYDSNHIVHHVESAVTKLAMALILEEYANTFQLVIHLI